MTHFYGDFQVPQVPGNVSMIADGTAYLNVDTQVLNVQAECFPANISNISLGPTGNFSFSASLSSSCRETYSGTLEAGSSAWLGTFAFADLSCVHDINSNAPSINNYTGGYSVAPVAFGFMANGTAASTAFCYGYQRVFNATVKFDLRLGAAVWPLENVTYISDHPLEQFVINGCVPTTFSS